MSSHQSSVYGWRLTEQEFFDEFLRFRGIVKPEKVHNAARYRYHRVDYTGVLHSDKFGNRTGTVRYISPMRASVMVNNHYSSPESRLRSNRKDEECGVVLTIPEIELRTVAHIVKEELYEEKKALLLEFPYPISIGTANIHQSTGAELKLKFEFVEAISVHEWTTLVHNIGVVYDTVEEYLVSGKNANGFIYRPLISRKVQFIDSSLLMEYLAHEEIVLRVILKILQIFGQLINDNQDQEIIVEKSKERKRSIKCSLKEGLVWEQIDRKQTIKTKKLIQSELGRCKKDESSASRKAEHAARRICMALLNIAYIGLRHVDIELLAGNDEDIG